jgi:Domain of unknown function (DUF4145)
VVDAKNWVCPHCNRPQTLTKGQSFTKSIHFELIEHQFGEAGLDVTVVACANPDCGELTVAAELTRGHMGETQGSTHAQYTPDKVIHKFLLRPEADSKPQPDFIPEVLRADYYEACLIKDKSPKAAATLARRCLQGMIRDFCGIANSRLIDEIKALKAGVATGVVSRNVTVESVEAIDHVRYIGNIGAHMEKDVSVITSVEPGEAQAPIDLVEMLFDEWYVNREVRKARLADLKGIGDRNAHRAVPTKRGEAQSAPIEATAEDEATDATASEE